MLFFLTAGSLVTYAQLQRSTSLPGALGKGPIVAFPRGIKQSSGEVSYILASDTAGNINLVPLHANNYDAITRPLLLRKPFLKVHGNVMYDYYYQSGIVIPYISKKIFTSIQYRFISTSQSGINTPYASVSQQPEETQPPFRNITGMNMLYTNRNFKNLLYDKLQKWDGTRISTNTTSIVRWLLQSLVINRYRVSEYEIRTILFMSKSVSLC